MRILFAKITKINCRMKISVDFFVKIIYSILLAFKIL